MHAAGSSCRCWIFTLNFVISSQIYCDIINRSINTKASEVRCEEGRALRRRDVSNYQLSAALRVTRFPRSARSLSFVISYWSAAGISLLRWSENRDRCRCETGFRNRSQLLEDVLNPGGVERRPRSLLYRWHRRVFLNGSKWVFSKRCREERLTVNEWPPTFKGRLCKNDQSAWCQYTTRTCRTVTQHIWSHFIRITLFLS